MSTITTIAASDLITNSRSTINTNFSNLNTDKFETSNVDTDTTLAANSNTKVPSQKAIKAYVDALGTLAFVPTGAIMPFASDTPPTGFLVCDGSAVSRSTYSVLYGVTSTNFGAGNGSTTFNIPDLRNRFPMGSGTATKVATFVSRASNVITVSGISDAANNEFQTGQAVLYTAASGAMTGLTHNTVYYVVRVSNLTFSLATTLALAQAGTVISLSSDGTGTQTFTKTLTARTLGQTGGEETHAMSSTELVPHTHTATVSDAVNNAAANFGGAANGGSTSTATTNSDGGNVAMNVLNPFAVISYIIKT
jgi:microcystin-dependent protein